MPLMEISTLQHPPMSDIFLSALFGHVKLIILADGLLSSNTEAHVTVTLCCDYTHHAIVRVAFLGVLWMKYVIM